MRYCRFFFTDTATTGIYTLSLHDALPISEVANEILNEMQRARGGESIQEDVSRYGASLRRSGVPAVWQGEVIGPRSEEHTSELQSQFHLVCRLLLEKKNTAPAWSYGYHGV